MICLNRSDGKLGDLKYGEIIISPYNNAAYKLVGIRQDLDLNAAFPAYPKREFYDPNTTQVESQDPVSVCEWFVQVYKGNYVPNRSGKQFKSFLDYYTRHWKFEGLDVEQPLLECVSFKQLSIVKKAKNLLNPIWKQCMDIDTTEETHDDWNIAVHLVPQLVVLYPLNYQFWKALSFIVAICWKMESMIKVDELRNRLFPPARPLEHCPAPPNVAMIYESVTTKSSHEHCTYERLEFIGDAALKYVSSIYCFFKYPVGHEGTLTTQRSAIISNRKLADVAVSLGLENYIRTIQIGDHPWRPAGCQFLDAYWIGMGKDPGSGPSWFGGRNQKVSNQKEDHQSKVCQLGVKQVADVVEGLIGACFIHGGIPCVCALLDRMGLLEEPASFLLATSERNNGFGAWLQGIEEVMDTGLDGLDEFEQMRQRQFDHGRDIDALETSINYKFESPSFALEALTHCSWPHQDPPCYQRLEYLGDAVLDFMISIHYYKEHPNIDPGSLTGLRAASVNNDRLAATAVKAELFKYILHFSAYLQSHISDFVSGFSGNGDEGAPKVLGDVVESMIGASMHL